MVSESRKAANVKWDKANMTNVSCRVPKWKAKAFKEECGKLGKTPNKVLNEYIQSIIDEAAKKSGE